MLDPLLLQMRKTFHDRYQVVKLIGRGGMGSVFMASQPATSRLFAIKVLHGVVTSKDYMRFDREVGLLSRIDHPNVVRVTDYGRAPDGTAFLVMEHVPGEPLHTLLVRHGRLALERALRVVFHVAAGLGAVHESGIVHRDVKPENIMVSDHFSLPDFAILLDFGIAREFSSFEPGSVSLTSKGVFLGTPRYASPEAVSGEPLTTRSDIYSLGCVLYQLLCDRCPFEDPSPLTVMDMQLKRRPVPVIHASRVPIRMELASLVDAMLEKRPEHRPRDMAEVTDRLAAELHELSAYGRGRFGMAPPVIRAMRTPELVTLLESPPPATVRPPAPPRDPEPSSPRASRSRLESIHPPSGNGEPDRPQSSTRSRQPSWVTSPRVTIAVSVLALVGWMLFLVSR